MRIAINRNHLWHGVDTILDVIPSKPAIPALSNMLLSASEQGVSLAATDMDLSVRTRLEASVEQPGTVTIPARPLADIVRDLPESELTLEQKDGPVLLSGSLGMQTGIDAAYSLPGGSSEDYPSISSDLPGMSLDLSHLGGIRNHLAEMVIKTSFAVARDDTRPVLNGALWQVEENGICIVATDTHRFSYYHLAIDLSEHFHGETRNAIVPPPALSQIVKLLQRATNGTLHIVIGDSQLLIDTGDTQLITRLIEGPYVDYQQVIPRNTQLYLSIEADQLLAAVRRVSVLASSYTHQVQLHMRDNSVELSASSPEIGGNAREMIPAAYTENPLEVGYNARYLMEILRHMQGQNVVFSLESAHTAALLRPSQQQEGHDYFCLLMPLRSMG